MKAYEIVEKQKRDRASASYDDWFKATKGALFDLRERDLFVQLIKGENAHLVLEIGSGTGRISEVAARHVDKIVATDLSFHSLKVLASKHVPGCTPLCLNSAVGLPFQDNSIDLAISCQVLPLLRFDDLVVALREINRVLKPGKLLVFTAYNFHYWRYKGIFEIGEPGGAYYRRFSEGYVEYLADKCKFEVVRVGYYKSTPLRLLTSKSWLTVDQVVCSVPWLNKRLSTYAIAVLRKVV